MILNPKLQSVSSAEKGRALAEWMNKQESDGKENSVVWLISWCTAAERERRKCPIESIPENFWKISVSAQTRVRTEGGRPDFDLVPSEDEDSQALFAFWELWRSGKYGRRPKIRHASRLRRCPNCKRFWYCSGRADKAFCSDGCRVSFRQRTPHGRKVKREYMRRYRATLRRLYDKNQHGRTLKRGRNLQVTLSKGK